MNTNTENRIEAELESYPGSSVSYGIGDDLLMFDRRCRWCARFLKTPKTVQATEGGKTDAIGRCSRCGDVQLLFEGYF